MDLRKVTCSECKSHLHYMENMSVKKNGVTMHFGDRFCMGGKKPRKFGRGDPKIYVPTWCPKRKVPSELRIYGFKSVEQWMLHHDMCEQLGTDISPSAFRYAVAYELHTPLTNGATKSRMPRLWVLLFTAITWWRSTMASSPSSSIRRRTGMCCWDCSTQRLHERMSRRTLIEGSREAL